MMNIIDALLLGIVQGITEFLPISSSGHLAVANRLLQIPPPPLLFDVLLHGATLGAICLFFRKKIGSICITIWHLAGRCIKGKVKLRTPRHAQSAQDWHNFHEEIENLRLVLIIVIATAITGVMGWVLIDVVSELREMPDIYLKVVGVCFWVTGILIIMAHYRSRSLQKQNRIYTISHTSYRQSIGYGILLGCVQGIAVLPGISRAGITISVVLFLGISRVKAGELSFLMSIPAILGALVLTILQSGGMDSSGAIGGEGSFGSISIVIAGIASAFCIGFLALVLLLRVLRNGKFGWFVPYLLVIGIVSIIL